MRSSQELEEVIQQYGDTVERICLLHLGQDSDRQDVFQNVFLKYALSTTVFQSPEHRKAWLIRVTINACRDRLRSFFRRFTVSLEEGESLPAPSEDGEYRELLEAVRALPGRYRDVIYLFYYEGYTALEIAQMLGKSPNTIYTWLARARDRLRETLGGERS